jgi:signal transduction histidine kinase
MRGRGAQIDAFSRTGRWFFTLTAILPVATALGIAAWLAVGEGVTRELGCWVLPNARVLKTPGDGACPFRSNDQIRRVEVRGGRVQPVDSGAAVLALVEAGDATGRMSVLRAGREPWAKVPIREVSRRERLARVAAAAVVAGGLLSIPLFLLWRSRARAAIPFALLYSVTALVAATAIAGRRSEWLTRAALLALSSAPAIVAHLGFTFPRERWIIRRVPGLMAAPYVGSLVLVTAGAFALNRNALLWPSFVYLLLALTGGAWLIVIVSCGFAIAESTSAVERARARLLCFGAMILPVLPTLLWIPEARGPAEVVTAYLWVSAVVMPLPIGLAISHYNLFNLEWDVRRWIGRTAYLGAAAVLLTLFLEVSLALAGTPSPLGDPVLTLVVAFGCVVAMEALRGRMLDFLEARLVPRVRQLRALRKSFEGQMARLQDEDALARHLGDALERGLSPRSGCVFVSAGAEWRAARPFGAEPPIRKRLAAAAVTVLAGRPLVHLALEGERRTAEHAALQSAGVDLAAVVSCAGEPLGLVLLASGPRRTPYTDAELDFAAAVTAHAGIALHNTRLTRELLDAERSAAAGQVALGFAHDLGKEFDWLARLVRRLPQRVDDPARMARDIAMIHEFTEGLVEGIRKFVGDAVRPVRDGAGMVKVDDMVDQAIRQVSRRHGEDRVTRSVEPGLRSLRCHEHVGRAVANLLDNALHATPEGDAVHLFATREDEWIRIAIRDRGSGMSEAVVRSAFEPGFTTRREQGGLGIGLTVAREIVVSLGGTLALEPGRDGGTRATIRVPAGRG